MDKQGQNGLLSTFHHSWRNRGLSAWLIAGALVTFYTLLYFTEVFTPIAAFMGLRSKWFFYGLVYTIALCGGAVFYLRHAGNSRYNRLRITVNVLVQVLLAFTLPLVMPLFFTANPDEYDRYEVYVSYFWPLAWYDLHPSTLEHKATAIAAWSVIGALVVSPVAAFFFGKRWYCSWVCGCGGLANTLGDPWRHLTASSQASWRFEKVAVYTVLVLAIVSTGLITIAHHVDGMSFFKHVVSGGQWWSVRALYGFVVGSVLSGVVGTGLYPLLGPRSWCRNFCPMAAVLGLIQKIGRFRIRVKKDMCISCGNCTTYCEMGIDVRAYAERNESFVRASCVGCGACAHVCPRGVLRLENVTKSQKRGLPVVK